MSFKNFAKEILRKFGNPTYDLLISKTIYYSTTQPIKKSIYLSVNQFINKFTNQQTNQPINQPINKLTNQSKQQHTNLITITTANQSYQLTNKSINQSTINKPNYKSTNY